MNTRRSSLDRGHRMTVGFSKSEMFRAYLRNSRKDRVLSVAKYRPMIVVVVVVHCSF